MMVKILMATYNGAKYIEQQISSIISQDFADWKMFIRDDNSNDSTLEILKRYEEIESRITIIPSDGNHGSAVKNFSSLFDFTWHFPSKYIMFADQDDIWDKTKISKSLEKMRYLEEIYANKPILIYSQFQYISDLGNTINEFLYMPENLSLPVLVNQNHAYGCTMLLNNSLVDTIKSIPTDVVNHDHWIAMVACTFGHATLLPDKTVFYRQHSSNVSGGLKNRTISARFKRYIQNFKGNSLYLEHSYILINTFLKFYYKDLDKKNLDFFTSYIAAMKGDNLNLIRFIFKHKIRKIGFFQSTIFYITLFFLRKKSTRFSSI